MLTIAESLRGLILLKWCVPLRFLSKHTFQTEHLFCEKGKKYKWKIFMKRSLMHLSSKHYTSEWDAKQLLSQKFQGVSKRE